MSQENSGDTNIDVAPWLFGILAFLFWGPLFGYGFVRKRIQSDNFLLKKYSKKDRSLALALGLLISVPVSFVIIYLKYSYHPGFIYFLNIPAFLITYPAVFLFAETVFSKILYYRISDKNLKTKTNLKEFINLEPHLLDENNMPLGISKLTKSPVTIPIDSRVRHLMVTGSHGVGKTSLAFTMMRHDMIWGKPIIFLDPKANIQDIKVAKKYAQLYKRDSDFLFFSPSNPEESVVYNPLKIGGPQMKSEKLVFALGLTHEHWGNVASSLMMTIFEVYEILEIEPTLENLEILLFNKKELFNFFERINELESTEQIERLKLKFVRFEKIKADEISGLQHGINKLNSEGLRDVLNPRADRKEIDLVDIIENRGIAYFDVNPNERRELMRQVSKFLIKDLEILSGLMQKKKINLREKFAGVYIDEFDTFAGEDFHEFLKVARSARMSLTILFQSVSGLDHIGLHLKEQLSTNTSASIHFLASAPSDLDFISQQPGTMKLQEQSEQVDKSNIKTMTGKGTEFTTEVFKLDPNLVRELKMDEFIIYHKERSGNERLDLVDSWSGKAFLKNAHELSELQKLKNGIKKRAFPLPKKTKKG